MDIPERCRGRDKQYTHVHKLVYIYSMRKCKQSDYSFWETSNAQVLRFSCESNNSKLVARSENQNSSSVAVIGKIDKHSPYKQAGQHGTLVVTGIRLNKAVSKLQ